MASNNLKSAIGPVIRDLQTAFPEFLPVDARDFLAYSCAAARELHPLPCLRHKAKTRKPKDISKNAKYVVSGIYRAAIVKVNRRPPGDVKLLV